MPRNAGPNDGQKKSVHLGEGRDKASRGETRQEVTYLLVELNSLKKEQGMAQL